MKKAGYFLTIALLLVSAYGGLNEGLRQVGQSGTPLQRSVSFAVLSYGVLAVAGIVGLIRRRPWAVGVIAAWSLATLYAATVASFAFHDPTFKESDTLIGTTAAFVSLAVVCALMLWAARVATRLPPPAETAHIPRP